MLNNKLLMKFCSPLLFLSLMLLAGTGWSGGNACVMAKYNGQTFDYEMIVGKDHPIEAIELAEARLAERGFDNYYKELDVRHAQAISFLERGYAIVIRSEFKNWRDKDHSVMGCGFSGKSYDDALWEAIRDAQVYYWGWKPDRDKYKIVKKLRF